MAIIQDDVQRLDRLITDISDASRLDAELSRAVSAPVDIGEMLATLVAVTETNAREHEVHLGLDLAKGQSLTVNGLEGRLVQVFHNLIANAISFSPKGGTIALTARRVDSTVIAEVSDDGPGIPEGKEKEIFLRFYSQRPAGEKFGTHSGLGLSISKQIVDAHDGTISAENRYRPDGSVAGARFRVCLPAA
jgi:two-component system sensor histidine kinase ChvG